MRLEIVVEGSADPADREDAEWREYGFKGKPGDPRRMPRPFAPYHLRLDWMMWFAALSPAYARPWFGAFAERLLAGDRDTLRLLGHNPFPDEPPVGCAPGCSTTGSPGSGSCGPPAAGGTGPVSGSSCGPSPGLCRLSGGTGRRAAEGADRPAGADGSGA